MSLSETLPPAASAAAGAASAPPADGAPGAAAPGWVVAAVGAAAAVVAALVFADRFRELYAAWSHDDNYSHGFLVPVVSAYLAWAVFRRQGLPARGNLRSGLLWVGVGCGLHLWAVVIWWPPVDFLALATLLYGSAVLAGGRRWAAGFAFPILFLFFMFPVSPVLLNRAATGLQEVVATSATWVLQLFVPAYQKGNTIHLPGHPLEVGVACSGLRQVVAFAALTLLVAHLSRRRWGFRVGIVLAGLPIAVAANLLRVVLMAFLTMNFGPESISEEKTVLFGVSYHTAWGLLTMAAGLGLLLAVAWWLGRVFPDRPAAGGGGAGGKPAAEPKPGPVVPTRALAVRLGAAALCLAATAALQGPLQAHLRAGDEISQGDQYLTNPLTGAGDKGFPVSLGAWLGKEATPDPATLSIYQGATERLSRLYVLDDKDDGADNGLACKLWMVQTRDGSDRQHHPRICMAVAGCKEDPSGQEEVALDDEGVPARRFRFFSSRADERSYSYVYYWYYTFEPTDAQALSPLQRIHEGWAVRPSLTVEVFTAARTPEQLGRAAEFVRRVDHELQAHLPAGARRGSEPLPMTLGRAEP